MSMLDTDSGCQMEPFKVQPMLPHASFATMSPIQEYAEREDKGSIHIVADLQCNSIHTRESQDYDYKLVPVGWTRGTGSQTHHVSVSALN